MTQNPPERRVRGLFVLLFLIACVAALGSVIWFGAGR